MIAAKGGPDMIIGWIQLVFKSDKRILSVLSTFSHVFRILPNIPVLCDLTPNGGPDRDFRGD